VGLITFCSVLLHCYDRYERGVGTLGGLLAGERRERVENWWGDGNGSGADNLFSVLRTASSKSGVARVDTIEAKISAIHFFHQLYRELILPEGYFLLGRMKEGMGREEGCRSKKPPRMPLRWEHLTEGKERRNLWEARRKRCFQRTCPLTRVDS
jgi:hypothetical protein